MNLRHFFVLFFFLIFLACAANAQTITLLKPIDADPCVPGTYTEFSFQSTSAGSTCYLYTNQSGAWAVFDTAYAVAANTTAVFNESLSPGWVLWGVRCSNVSGSLWDSVNYTFYLKNVPYCATLTETACPLTPNIDGVGIFKTRLMNTKGMSLENQDCNVWIENSGGIVVKAFNTMLTGHSVKVLLDNDGNWINTADQKVPLTDSQGYYVMPFRVDGGWAWYGDTYTVYASCNGISTSCSFTTDKTRLPDVNNMEAFGREASGTVIAIMIIILLAATYGGAVIRKLRGR